MTFDELWEKEGLLADSFIDKEFCRSLWQDAFKEGYKLGKNSRIGLNNSGCVCTFDEQGKVATPCQAHLDWREDR